jgi:hypothetical protein
MNEHGHFLVVGGQRCGTTYLVSQLKRRLEVAMAAPERPEPKAFLSALTHREYDARYFGNRPAGLMLGEKSTTYMDRPESAGLARSGLPEARVIAVLRDPVDRAISNFRFSVAHGMEDLPMEQALSPQAEDRPYDPALSASPFHYLRRGLYTRSLAPWISAFPQDSVLLVEFGQLVSPESPSWQRIFAFLGLPDAGQWRPDPQAVNPSSPGDPPGEALLSFLSDYFSDETARVGEELGVDTSGWRSRRTDVAADHD